MQSTGAVRRAFGLLARVRKLVAHFRPAEQGQVLLTFSLAVIPITAAVGAAVDYSRASSVKAAMQGALDSAMLSVATENAGGNGDVSSALITRFKAVLRRPEAQNVQLTGSYDSTGALSAEATATVPADFFGLLGVTNMKVAVRAKVGVALPKGCVLALDKTAPDAASIQGTGTLQLNGCALYDDSNSGTALSLGGSASLTADFVGVVGNISGYYSINASKGIRTGIRAVPDPYADLTIPTFSGCDQRNFNGKNTMTISPGVYCGGMNFNANAVITFSPGIYYIDGGSFTVNGGAVLTGTGVTLVFTSSTGSNWPTATINGGASISLSAPNSGPMGGLVVVGDRRMTTGTVYKLLGGANQVFGGGIYLPKAALSYSGNNSSPNGCIEIIADTIAFSGNSSLSINCAAYGTKAVGSTTPVLLQ